MITNYLLGRVCIRIIRVDILCASRQELLLHRLIRHLLVQLELQGLRVQLVLRRLIVELLVELFGVDGQGHGSNILINDIVILGIAWILQVRRIFLLVKVLGLTTTPVLHLLVAEAERIPVSVSVVATHHCLSLLHVGTGAELHVVDAVTDALLLVNLSICVVSVRWQLSVIFDGTGCLPLPISLGLSTLKHCILSHLLFPCLLHSFELLLLIQLLTLSRGHLRGTLLLFNILLRSVHLNGRIATRKILTNC